MQSINRPRHFWNHHGYVVGCSIAVLVVFGIFTPFDKILDRRFARQREQAWRQGLDALDDAQGSSQLDFHDLAIHVWAVRRTRAHPFVGELLRSVSIRVGHHGTNRQVTFVKGSGVVGRCWATKNETEFDSNLIYAGITTEADWNARAKSEGEEFTGRLSYQDFLWTKHLSATVAVPILTGRKRFRGCVSADTTNGALSDLKKSLPALRRYRDALANLDMSRIDA
jgi:hypothetical protein